MKTFAVVVVLVLALSVVSEMVVAKAHKDAKAEAEQAQREYDQMVIDCNSGKYICFITPVER